MRILGIGIALDKLVEDSGRLFGTRLAQHQRTALVVEDLRQMRGLGVRLDDAIERLDLLLILPPAAVDRSDTIESFVTPRRHTLVSTTVER